MDPQVCAAISGTGIRHRDIYDLCRTDIKDPFHALASVLPMLFQEVWSLLKKGTLLLVRKRQMQKLGTL